MRYRELFPQGKQLFVVIHAENIDQVGRNVGIAREQGADGVFLIGHSLPAQKLAECYRAIRVEHPNWFMGINFLGLSNQAAIQYARELRIDALWLDNAGSGAVLNNARETYGAEQLCIFGGVAFKYQTRSVDPAREAQLIAPFVEVVTTSGERTGEPPSVEKISSMKAAIGPKPLAIASGITPDNARSFTPHADCFLVATGVSRSFTELDPAKVRALRDILDAG